MADLPASDPLALCLALTRASAVVTNRLDRSLSGLHGLSFQDFSILYHLSRAPDQRLRRVDLALRLEMTPSGVTRSLLPLERRGMVERETDPDDARATYAVLGKAGKRVLADALVAARQVSTECLADVPAAHGKALHGALGRLAGINLSNS
ncbi:MAG: MarR family winged helix-turn-helix transcriptional regulator [Rubrivivax sp.]